MANEKMDIVLQSALKKVQVKFEQKYGQKVSLKQLYIIISIQNELTQNAIFTGRGIRLPNVGVFGISSRKSRYLTEEQIAMQSRLQTNSCLIEANSDIGY